MKNEVLYFIAKMAVALAVVDAFIPRTEHYMKSKHSGKEKEENKEETQHQYTNRLNTDLPDKDKMHLHPPHYNPPRPFQRHDPLTNAPIMDQHVSTDQIYAHHGSRQAGRSQEPESLLSLLEKQEREEKNSIDNTSDVFLSHPSIKPSIRKQLHLYSHP